MSNQQLTLSDRVTSKVLTVAKTKMADGALSVQLAPDLTLADATRQILAMQPKTDAERQVQQRLRGEITGVHDYFAIGQEDAIRKVSPNTKLHEIVVPREVKTPDGWQQLPIATFEVQAYAEVGTVEL